MEEAKTFSFIIPLRPKAVQSTRFSTHSYVDPKVKKWKKAVAEYIAKYAPSSPSKMPFEVVEAVYMFRIPKNITKKVKKKIEEIWEQGGVIPYLSKPDLSDNIHKGLSDVLTSCGIWEDDSCIWRVAPDAKIMKIYGPIDCIKITIRETPDIILINGKTARETYGYT